jgi:hypothetical protein
MKPVNGDAKANLERAKDELPRVLAFRGDVVGTKVSGQRIILKIAINPKWESDDKVSHLKECIPAKTRKVFEVISVSAGE